MILSPDGMPPAQFALAWASALAFAAYLVAASIGASRWVRPSLIAAWLAHAAAIAVHTFGGPGGARFGFAPAVSLTLWLVLAVYAIESRFVPLSGVRRGLAVIGAAVVALVWFFPGEMHPQAGSPWAPVHWVLGIASYALFGAAVLHAALWHRAERLLRHGPRDSAPPEPSRPAMPLLRLEKLTFRFVLAGFLVLSATLLLGGWFSPWRWDHKSVFSVLAWLVFAGLLIGRRAFGWRGRLATRWLYVGSGLLLLAYVGSRFVIEVLLHRASGAA